MYPQHAVKINCVAGTWEDAKIVDVAELCVPIQSTASVFGMSCYETVRITMQEDGLCALLCPQQIITSLCLKADAMFLPYPDSEKIFDALCKLIDLERELFYDEKFMYARIMISGSAVQAEPYPLGDATVTVMLMPFAEPKNNISLVCTAQKENNFVLAKAFENEGYDGILLLDNIYRKYILGTNIQSVFFRIGDTVVTPPVPDTVVRECVIHLMKEWSIDVCERKISTDELVACRDLHEIFACDGYNGIVSITKIKTGENTVEIESGKLAKKLSDTFVNMEKGTAHAPTNWIRKV